MIPRVDITCFLLEGLPLTISLLVAAQIAFSSSNQELKSDFMGLVAMQIGGSMVQQATNTSRTKSKGSPFIRQIQKGDQANGI